MKPQQLEGGSGAAAAAAAAASWKMATNSRKRYDAVSKTSEMSTMKSDGKSLTSFLPTASVAIVLFCAFFASHVPRTEARSTLSVSATAGAGGAAALGNNGGRGWSILPSVFQKSQKQQQQQQEMEDITLPSWWGRVIARRGGAFGRSKKNAAAAAAAAAKEAKTAVGAAAAIARKDQEEASKATTAVGAAAAAVASVWEKNGAKPVEPAVYSRDAPTLSSSPSFAPTTTVGGDGGRRSPPEMDIEDDDGDLVEEAEEERGKGKEEDVELEEIETEDALVGFASGGGGDDDGDDLGDDGEGHSLGVGGGRGGGAPAPPPPPERWAYLEEIDSEEEPDWVAAYAALEEGIEDPPEERRVESREEAWAILRQAWARAAIPPPPAAAAVGGGSSSSAMDKKKESERVHKTAGFGEEEENGEEEEESVVISPFHRQSKAAARRELYHHFLQDLNTDTRTLGGKHWLDRDALIHLRGTALLCQQPEYIDLLSSLAPTRSFARGMRLAVPTSTHGMQEALAAALAHSVGAVLIVADHRRIAAVRRMALDAGVPKKFLGAGMVMGALIEMAEGEGQEEGGEGKEEGVDPRSSPLVIFLADKARPFLQSKQVTDALFTALVSKESTSFFLLSSEYDPDSLLPPLPPLSSSSVPHHHIPQHGGLLAPPPPTTGEGGGAGGEGLPDMSSLSGGGGGGGEGGRSLPSGIPMPWPPGMMSSPSSHQQGGGGGGGGGAFPPKGPVLHVLIRPSMVPAAPTGGGGGGGAAAAGNGTVGVQGLFPSSASLGGASGFAPLLKKTVAELAEHFHELSKERLVMGQEGKEGGRKGGRTGGLSGEKSEEREGVEEVRGMESGKEEDEEEEEAEEDEDEDEDEDEEDDEDSLTHRSDRAAAESSALAQLAQMLETLNKNENFHRALQAHVAHQHHQLQQLGLAPSSSPSSSSTSQPPPAGMGNPNPAAAHLHQQFYHHHMQQQQQQISGAPPGVTMGPDGMPLFQGMPMVPAYQITFAFPPLNINPPPPSSRTPTGAGAGAKKRKGTTAAAAAAAFSPNASTRKGGGGGGGGSLPFARWFSKKGDPSTPSSSPSSSNTYPLKRTRSNRKSSSSSSSPSSSSSLPPSFPPDLDTSPSPSEQDALLSLFEDCLLLPTKDATLKARWDKLIADDNERHNAKRTYSLLKNALVLHRLLCPDLTPSNPLLYKVQLKAGAETLKVLSTAIEVDVGGGGGGGKAGGGGSSAGGLPKIVTEEDGAFHLLSLEGLETALGMVCKTSVPRPGNPISRTKEEVTALAQNRHEHALVPNVISPTDIGVTYQEIGGLADVKETLRQCVTYPLRFPHLYSEGIAADSVKGVLLFG